MFISFHHSPLSGKLSDNVEHLNYAHGIMQNIGYKELFEYLHLSEEEKKTDNGKSSLLQGKSKGAFKYLFF